MSPTETEILYTYNEVAEMFRVSIPTVKNWVYWGKLKACGPTQRTRRITASELEEFKNKRIKVEPQQLEIWNHAKHS